MSLAQVPAPYSQPQNLHAKKSPETKSGTGQKIGWLRPTKGAFFKAVTGYRQSCAARSKLEGMKFDASKWRSYKNTLPPFGAL